MVISSDLSNQDSSHIREHVEMCEKTHALRLQFEYEKNMWLAKHRSAAFDEAFYRRQCSNAPTADQHSKDYEQSRQTKEPTMKYSAIEISEEGLVRSPESEHRYDMSNSFIYDVPDEKEYIPVPSKVEEPEDDEQDMTRRKKKFSTPARYSGVKSVIAVGIDGISEDGRGSHMSSGSAFLPTQHSIDGLLIDPDPYPTLSRIDEAYVRNGKAAQSYQIDDTYNSTATDDTFSTSKTFIGLPVSLRRSDDTSESYMDSCIFNETQSKRHSALHGQEPCMKKENQRIPDENMIDSLSNLNSPNGFNRVDLCQTFEDENESSASINDPSMEALITIDSPDYPLSTAPFDQNRIDHTLHNDDGNQSCFGAEIAYDDFCPAAPTSSQGERVKSPKMNVPGSPLGLHISLYSNAESKAIGIESNHTFSESAMLNDTYLTQNDLMGNCDQRSMTDCVENSDTYCEKNYYESVNGAVDRILPNSSRDAALYSDNFILQNDTYATLLDERDRTLKCSNDDEHYVNYHTESENSIVEYKIDNGMEIENEMSLSSTSKTIVTAYDQKEIVEENPSAESNQYNDIRGQNYDLLPANKNGIVKQKLLTKSALMPDILPTQLTLISDILPPQPTLISDILPTQPTLISDILPPQPTLISDMLLTQPTLISDILPTQLTLISDTLPPQPTLISDILPPQPTLISDILLTQPTLISDILPPQPT